MDAHALPTTKGWSPMHTPGLGVPLAAPWSLAGVLAARIALCAIALSLLAMGCWRQVRDSISPHAAWFAVLGIVGGVATIGPNSMELNRYGGGGPAGRFAWSAMWLWIVVTGFLWSSRRGIDYRPAGWWPWS